MDALTSPIPSEGNGEAKEPYSTAAGIQLHCSEPVVRHFPQEDSRDTNKQGHQDWSSESQ
ncbi:MAG: hypothetical protein NPIRA03_21050 [Nitrospirales bacterium]|nr:MAG: hypothetical protein NPIRA03_21050 [Nitrospirales bacterium]